MKNSECFFSFEEARNKIEFWCSYRDRSTYETIQKLRTYQLSEEEIQQIINHLEELNFLNDERFAQSFVSGKFRIKRWGRRKIYAEISQKRISKTLIQQALFSIDEEEYEKTISELIDKKTNLLSSEKNPHIKKQKVIQYLVSRGFEYEQIQDVLAKKP